MTVAKFRLDRSAENQSSQRVPVDVAMLKCGGIMSIYVGSKQKNRPKEAGGPLTRLGGPTRFLKVMPRRPMVPIPNIGRANAIIAGPECLRWYVHSPFSCFSIPQC